MPWPVTAWLVMYLIFNLIWLAIFPVDETVMQYFRMRVLTVVYSVNVRSLPSKIPAPYSNSNYCSRLDVCI
jgi:hypothetical protein